MPRVTFNSGFSMELPTGYRTISRDDVTTPFMAPMGKMREYPLKYFYEWSFEANNIVLLKKGKGKEIEGLAAMSLQKKKEKENVITLEMISRNKLTENRGEIASHMISVIRKYIAPQLSVEALEVESIEDLKDFYINLGFTPTGIDIHDSYWGKVSLLFMKV